MLLAVVLGKRTLLFCSVRYFGLLTLVCTRPYIANPDYKGKWYAPMIDNPAYKGDWAPRKIRNPDYFEDLTPVKSLNKIVKFCGSFDCQLLIKFMICYRVALELNSGL